MGVGTHSGSIELSKTEGQQAVRSDQIFAKCSQDLTACIFG
ncbi:hypothetical protein [Frederiksenia canicola]|nr:hypothetical protein [Frederiksenia canicola]